MKQRILTMAVAGIMGMTLLVSGGCCHMHRHHDNKCCSCDCKKSSCCDKSPAGEMPCNGKDCPKTDKK